MEIKQVVVTGQNQVELQKAEIDDKNLGPNELLIETEFTFISAGTELANYTGKEPKVFQPGAWCAYPWRSGYANVGIVRAIGNRVTRAKPGDRVFTYGNHASAIRYNETRLIIQVPQNIEPSIAAASRMAGVATTAVIVGEITHPWPLPRGEHKSNPWVVVFGLGMVGNLASQAFRIRGCRVIGVDPVETRRKLAERCGIPYTVGGDVETVQKVIGEITQGKMGNITVDAVGHSSVVMQALKATANYGQLIILGSPRVSVQGNLTELLSDVHLRWITIRGALEWCLPMYSESEKVISQFSKQQMIFDWIHRGELKIEPLISHCLKPEQIKEAYDGLLNEPEKYTGVVLDWR
ncbi:zinc-binding alcohol dehydrogenase [Candidatus Poribacteria bacterium]|nr:zinc-binding alcohol dehydrogenase [Candidatus Poribacteria bacterium]